MRHQITKIKETKNGWIFKIAIQIPFKMGWIERVKFSITTFNQKDAYQMQYIKNEEEYAFFETTIELKNSAIYHYYFSFEANGRFMYYKKKNITGDCSLTKEECWKMSVGFDVPEWAKGAMMYHIFIDKYRKGKNMEKTPMPKRTIHQDWYEPPVIGPNRNGDWNVDFHCGDLKGIIETLNYIKKLGVDIIYLSPIVRSQSNHRYDTADYENVDPYVGTNELLLELCKRAHQKGIKVILDGVFNHTGNDSIYFNEYGTYNTVGAYQDTQSPYTKFYKKIYSQGGWNFAYWWGMKNLPVCNCESSAWIEFICGKGGVIDKWFKLGIDGLRLDVADELTDYYIEQIHKAVKRNKRDGLILGEVWKNPMRMNRGYISSGKCMHSVMNYLLVDALIRYYKYCDFGKLERILKEILTEYPTETIQTLMNFTSTHDISRAIEIFGCDYFNPYGEWAWNLRNDSIQWVKNHKMTQEEYRYGKKVYKSYAFALAFMPGIFSVFYGDEVGIKGIGNLANRGPYPWKNRDKDLLKYFREIGNTRQKEKFLKKAEFKIKKIDFQHFMFERYDNDESILVIVSRIDSYTNIDIPEEYKNAEILFKIKGSTKKQLPPYGAIALKK